MHPETGGFLMHPKTGGFFMHPKLGGFLMHPKTGGFLMHPKTGDYPWARGVLDGNHVLARKIGSFRVVLYDNRIGNGNVTLSPTQIPAGHFGADRASGPILWILWLIHWMFLKTFPLYASTHREVLARAALVRCSMAMGFRIAFRLGKWFAL